MSSKNNKFEEVKHKLLKREEMNTLLKRKKEEFVKKIESFEKFNKAFYMPAALLGELLDCFESALKEAREEDIKEISKFATMAFQGHQNLREFQKLLNLLQNTKQETGVKEDDI